MLTLDRITVFPIKSLDGFDVEECRLLPGGGLENDRRWQLVDMDGRVVNAKRTPLLHAIRAEWDLPERLVTLAIDPAALETRAIPGIERLASLTEATFPLVPGTDGPCDWLSAAVGARVLLVERADGGFPDDRDAPGPTLVATATLVEVARWFGFELDEARRRFRANLEVGGCGAFWEDACASPARPDLAFPTGVSSGEAADPYADLPPPEPREISVGNVRLRATNVCRRCVVPSRDQRTGAVTERFRDAFEIRRRRGLPADVDAGDWGTLYRLAVNTACVTVGTLAIGMPVARL